MTEREILEKKLKELKRLEAKEFQKKHYPEMAKFIGKCYCCVDKQYKSVNSTYFKIVDIKPGDVYCGGPDNNTPLARCTCLFFPSLPILMVDLVGMSLLKKIVNMFIPSPVMPKSNPIFLTKDSIK